MLKLIRCERRAENSSFEAVRAGFAEFDGLGARKLGSWVPGPRRNLGS